MSGNAIIYCRISTKGQEQGGSLMSQETACRNYCKRKGYNTIDVFKDTFTGGELDRPGLNRLFEFIDKAQKENQGGITHFIVEDIDRIARDYQVHLRITTELQKRGIKYETVNMRFEDTPVGKFVEGVMALNAQLFRETNKDRVISKQEARLLDGFRTFSPPTGYKTVEAPQGGKLLVPDEPNASIIKEGLEGYANGTFSSLREVANFWGEKGINFSRKGKDPSGKKVYIPTVSKIFNNVLYAGMIEYQKITYNKDGTIKNEWNIPLREGKHEGLIDYDTHLKIQEKLNSRRPYTHDKIKLNKDFPLRGFLVCECCGLHMSSGYSKGKHKSYPYYQFNKQCINKGKSASAIQITKKIEQDIQNLEVEEGYYNLMKYLIEEQFKEKEEAKKRKEESLISDIEKKEEQVDKLIEKISDDILVAPATKRAKKLMEEIEQAEKELEEIQNDNTLAKTLELALKMMEDPYFVWEKGDIIQKQLLLKIILQDKIKVDIDSKSYDTFPVNSLFRLANKPKVPKSKK